MRVKAELYDNGARHEHIMALKHVSRNSPPPSLASLSLSVFHKHNTHTSQHHSKPGQNSTPPASTTQPSTRNSPPPSSTTSPAKRATPPTSPTTPSTPSAATTLTSTTSRRTPSWVPALAAAPVPGAGPHPRAVNSSPSLKKTAPPLRKSPRKASSSTSVVYRNTPPPRPLSGEKSRDTRVTSSSARKPSTTACKFLTWRSCKMSTQKIPRYSATRRTWTGGGTKGCRWAGRTMW